MSAEIIRLPTRRLAIWIMRNDGAWLVIAGGHGWQHGDRGAAIADARWLADNLELPIRYVERAS